MISEIQIELEFEINVNEPGAAVAVARSGEISHTLTRGLANLEWAQKIHREMSVRADAKNLELTVNVDPALPEFIIADPLRLRQVKQHHHGILFCSRLSLTY